MNVLRQLKEEQTGMQWRSDFEKPAVTAYDCQETGGIKPMGFATSREYMLKATVGITFWANQAQYHDARKHAEKVLLDRLYGDTLRLLNEAQKCVYDGDAKATLAVIDKIRDNLTGT